MKPMGWVVDMRHYLDEETGDLPDLFATPVLNLALFFGSIVAWVTGHLPQGDWHTDVPCRRSPGRRRCLGGIMAEFDRTSGHIVWQCPVCTDHGLINGWEDTLWNGARPHRARRRPRRAIDPSRRRSSQRRQPRQQRGIVSPRRFSRSVIRGGRLTQFHGRLFHADRDFRVPIRGVQADVSEPARITFTLTPASRRCPAAVCRNTWGVIRRLGDVAADSRRAACCRTRL